MAGGLPLTVSLAAPAGHKGSVVRRRGADERPGRLRAQRRFCGLATSAGHINWVSGQHARLIRSVPAQSAIQAPALGPKRFDPARF